MCRVHAVVEDIDVHVGHGAVAVTRLRGTDVGIDAIHAPWQRLIEQLHRSVRLDVRDERVALQRIDLLWCEVCREAMNRGGVDVIGREPVLSLERVDRAENAAV